MSHESFEVIIIGAGVVGSVMGLSLAKAGFKVAIIDRKAPALAKIEPPGLLASTLTYGSIKYLNQLGVWNQLALAQKTLFTKMRVWEQHAWSQGIEFDSLSLHHPYLGAVVYNTDLLTCLHKTLAGNINCQWLTDVPEKLDQDATKIVVTLQNKGLVTGKLLIGADGASSWVKQQLGLSTQLQEYEQQALVANIKTTKTLNNTAWQVFTSYGPAALLPCGGENQASLVWSQHNKQAVELLALDKKTFSQKLTEVFTGKLGELTCSSQLLKAPLIRRHAQRYIDERIALIGDTVRTIHPLAGQGLNLGLLDVMKLGAVLMEAQQKQRDIGSEFYLRQYERQRRGHNQLMLSTMDFFHKLFANENKFLQKLRPLGLSAVNQIDFIKKQIMQQAMGIG